MNRFIPFIILGLLASCGSLPKGTQTNKNLLKRDFYSQKKSNPAPQIIHGSPVFTNAFIGPRELQEGDLIDGSELLIKIGIQKNNGRIIKTQF